MWPTYTDSRLKWAGQIDRLKSLCIFFLIFKDNEKNQIFNYCQRHISSFRLVAIIIPCLKFSFWHLQCNKLKLQGSMVIISLVGSSFPIHLVNSIASKTIKYKPYCFPNSSERNIRISLNRNNKLKLNVCQRNGLKWTTNPAYVSEVFVSS